MQRDPCATAYGRGGDVQDPHDAILGAARYLAAAGARHDEAGERRAFEGVGSRGVETHA